MRPVCKILAQLKFFGVLSPERISQGSQKHLVIFLFSGRGGRASDAIQLTTEEGLI